MAGNSTALCFIGAENVASASICSPSAIATEPIGAEVSTANIKGFCVILALGIMANSFFSVFVSG